MNSHITPSFRRLFRALPRDMQRQAREAYRLFKEDSWLPGLAFKRVHLEDPIYSARVSLDYRVLGWLENDIITWFWIGSHAEYDQMLKRLGRCAPCPSKSSPP